LVLKIIYLDLPKTFIEAEMKTMIACIAHDE
jgi:hypothetical protein